MKLTLFEKISAWFGVLTGFYSYGQRKNEPGVYINHAIAKNFGLHSGMMSESALDEFVMRSIGGVNGRKMRHGEQLMFKRHDGAYSAVTYEPMRDKTRGYVHEIKVKATDECLPLSALPNFWRLRSNAEYRAGDLFCIVKITPYENRGETFDYACIAEFFDTLRKKCEKLTIHWLGGREYVLMIKPEQRNAFSEHCSAEIHVDGRTVVLSVEKVYMEPGDTNDDQAKKIAFCLKKLRSGTVCGEFVFNRDEFERTQNGAPDITGAGLSFLPVISVKSGEVKYFNVIPSDANLTNACIQADRTEELCFATVKKLLTGVTDKSFPCVPYCVPFCGGERLAEPLKLLAEATKAPVFAELCVRAPRVEDNIEKEVARIKAAGAHPVIFDPAMKLCELCAVQRMGFEVIRAQGMDRDKLKACADFCRTFGLQCAVYGADLDEEFIALRRLGVDLCAGEVISAPVYVPDKTRFCEPLVLCDEEPKEEPQKAPESFDLSGFTAKVVYNAFSEEISRLVSPRKCDPMERLDKTEQTDKLDPLGECDLEPCDYEKGIGAKKDKKKKHKEKEKHKKEKSDKKKKKLQKKEIKKGKLKKIKLEKK